TALCSTMRTSEARTRGNTWSFRPNVKSCGSWRTTAAEWEGRSANLLRSNPHRQSRREHLGLLRRRQYICAHETLRLVIKQRDSAHSSAAFLTTPRSVS